MGTDPQTVVITSAGEAHSYPTIPIPAIPGPDISLSASIPLAPGPVVTSALYSPTTSAVASEGSSIVPVASNTETPTTALQTENPFSLTFSHGTMVGSVPVSAVQSETPVLSTESVFTTYTESSYSFIQPSPSMTISVLSVSTGSLSSRSISQIPSSFPVFSTSVLSERTKSSRSAFSMPTSWSTGQLSSVAPQGSSGPSASHSMSKVSHTGTKATLTKPVVSTTQTNPAGPSCTARDRGNFTVNVSDSYDEGVDTVLTITV